MEGSKEYTLLTGQHAWELHRHVPGEEQTSLMMRRRGDRSAAMWGNVLAFLGKRGERVWAIVPAAEPDRYRVFTEPAAA